MIKYRIQFLNACRFFLRKRETGTIFITDSGRPWAGNVKK
jgi:hypothetical protein